MKQGEGEREGGEEGEEGEREHWAWQVM